MYIYMYIYMDIYMYKGLFKMISKYVISCVHHYMGYTEFNHKVDHVCLRDCDSASTIAELQGCQVGTDTFIEV